MTDKPTPLRLRQVGSYTLRVLVVEAEESGEKSLLVINETTGKIVQVGTGLLEDLECTPSTEQ